MNHGSIAHTSKVQSDGLSTTKVDETLQPLAALIDPSLQSSLDTIIDMTKIKDVWESHTSDRAHSFRQDLAQSHRSPRAFQQLLSSRGKTEIGMFTATGLSVVLEWARKLKLGTSRWDTFASWYRENSEWPKEDNSPLAIEVAMAAGAHSIEMWREFVTIYEKGPGLTVPLDFLVLASLEQCVPLIRAHTHLASVTGTGHVATAQQEIRNTEQVFDSFVSSALCEFNGDRDSFYDSNRIIPIIKRAGLYYRCRFFGLRHIWRHVFIDFPSALSDAGYVIFLNSCGTQNRQEMFVSTDTMILQALEYWSHYASKHAKPYNIEVVFALVLALSNLNHKSSLQMGAELLTLPLSANYKRDILKSSLHAAAQQRNSDAFRELEEHCRSNLSFLGDMSYHTARYRAILLSHHPDDELMPFFYSTELNIKDRFLTDIVFRWLEQRSTISGYVLESLHWAEDILKKIQTAGYNLTSTQLESLLTLYAQSCDPKGVRLFLSVPREVVTQKAVVEVLRLLVLLGYRSNSGGDATKVWNQLTPLTRKALQRDDVSRAVFIRFYAGFRENDEVTQKWFTPKTLFVSSEFEHDAEFSIAENDYSSLHSGVSCTLSHFLSPGGWECNMHHL